MRRQRIDLVFERLYSCAELVRSLTGIDRKPPLQNQWSAVQFFGDEMHGAAVPLIAGVEHSLVSIEPRVGR